MKNYRYPGTRPFEEKDSHLFFGRSQDIENLYNRIFVEKMTVLHGKSGLGKTSLLQAGILPKLRQDADYQTVTVRFRAYQENYFVEPAQTLRDSLPETNPTDLPFIYNLLDGDDSFWATFKRLQVAGNKRFILFFDQFEELFTYPTISIRLFKSLFGELIGGNIPKKINKQLQEALKNGEIDEKQLNQYLQPIDIKVVFAIRSDRMSLLDRLADRIPTILRNLYELKPLDTEQAKEALLLPAQLGENDKEKYNFSTQAFDYEPDAVLKILNFLSKNNTQKIESFQLQIFCRWAEEFSDKNKDFYIETHDIGDPNLIFENYYESQLQTLLPEQRLTARQLIEDDLIFEKEERRLSLYEGVILDKIKDKKLLDALVNTRLLRAEPVQDGFAYEISHDTLVAPILKAKKLRTDEEIRQQEEQRQAEELRLEREKAAADRLEKEKTAKQLRKVRTLLAAAVVALALAIAAGFYALEQKNEADKQTEIAISKEKEAKKALADFVEAERKRKEAKINNLTETINTLRSLGKPPADAKDYEEEIRTLKEELNNLSKIKDKKE